MKAFNLKSIPAGTIVRVVLTRKDAEELLRTQNTGNRRLIPSAIRIYSADMKAGRWNTRVCEPLHFSVTERLMNGQNRLTAMLDAGLESLAFWVQTGLPDSAQADIDNGRSRKVTDFSDIDRVTLS